MNTAQIKKFKKKKKKETDPDRNSEYTYLDLVAMTEVMR